MVTVISLPPEIEYEENLNPTTDEVLLEAEKAAHHGEQRYISHIVCCVLRPLNKCQLLDLLMCVELKGDFRRLLPFADQVETLFTEDGNLGEKCYAHEYVQCAVRGYVTVRLCLY